MEKMKLKPLARAIAPSMILLGLTACGGGGGGGAPIVEPDDTPRATNEAPVAAIDSIGSPQSMGNEINFNGENSSDGDGDGLSYQWSITSAPVGSTAAIINGDTPLASLLGDLPGDYSIQLIVNDGTEDSAAVTASITLTNTAPVANAGEDMKVDLNGSVKLNGSASADIDGQALAFEWVIVEAPDGSSAYLDSSVDIMPTLLGIDLPGSYQVDLTVNDGFETSEVDSVVFSTNNAAPKADAGADVGGKAVGDTVMLDGTKSNDLEGDSLTYSWAFTDNIPSGSSAVLENPDTSMPSFTIDVKGSYELALTVSDGELSSTDMVLVNVGNSAPVAEAGANQVVMIGDQVQLDGSTSTDIDGDTLTFSWSILDAPQGSVSTLEDSSKINTSFSPDIDGHYVIQLVVSDGVLEATDSVEIDVSAVENLPPVANAGAAQFFEMPGETVVLDGSSSTDPEGSSLL